MILLGIQNPVWRFLGSVRLLIALLIVFVVICVLGSLAPQDRQPEAFHTGYFAALLLALCVNVIACTTRRLLLKSIRGTRLAGYLALHVGLIVVFLGGAVSAVGSERGFLQVWEGRTWHRYFNWKDQAERGLPFAVGLDRFSVERYEEYDPPTVFANIPEESYTSQFPADLKQTFKVGRASYWVTPLRYLPDFALDVKTGRAFAQSDQPNNPALLVEIRSDQRTERRWLLSRYPGLQIARDPRLMLFFHWRPLKVKQFVSEVRILEPQKPVRQATVAVNRPLRVGDWTIYQTSYDPQEHRWSGFQVSRDPGIRIVYLGFWLLAIGVILLLGLRPLLSEAKGEEP